MRKRRKFVVGYDNESNCVYGEEWLDCCKEGHCTPVILTKARELKRALNIPKAAVIYELVPLVSAKKGKK